MVLILLLTALLVPEKVRLPKKRPLIWALFM